MYTCLMAAPTKIFDEKDIDMLYDLARAGASYAKLTLALGITKPTFIKWRGNNPVFAEVVDRCKLLAQVYYEGLADKIITGADDSNADPEKPSTKKVTSYGAPSLLRFVMQTRFYSDYSGLGGNSWDPVGEV